MATIDLKQLVSRLNDLCRRALEAAAGMTLSRTHYNVEIEHWLTTLADRADGDIAAILRHYEIDQARFVTDLNRALEKLKTGNSRAPIRVAPDLKGEPSVAIADFQSEADEDSVAKDREETKRLLYVAITRARDRLYLSGSVGRNGFKPTRGALGDVLPEPVRALFTRAAAGIEPSVAWQSADGFVHELIVPNSEPGIETSEVQRGE